MKNIRKKISLYIGLAAIALASSCAPEIESTTPASTTTADFSKFIAIGNSLTSGFADGGLYLEGQQVAFPNLVAEKMQAFGGGKFTSPFFSEAQKNGSGYIRLKALVNGSPVMENVTDQLAYRAENKLTKYTEDIQNLGIPGMRLDLAFYAPFGAMNMYFERLLPDAEVGKTTYFDFTTQREHTFFSFWLGNNDILGYAMNGAVDDGKGTTTLTPVNTFGYLLNNYIGALTTKNQKGVIATIPDVTTIPYFTTVTRQALLQAASAAANTTINDLFITTKTGVRAAKDNDLFVLPFSSAGLLGKPNAAQIPYGFHPYNPIEDIYVLDEAEVVTIKNHINQVNGLIKQVASSKDLAVVDIYSFFNQVSGGYIYNGMNMSAKFITGNIFSLDGIHLTPIGNAIVANQIIDAINKKYGSSLEKVDATKYRAVKMP